MNENIGEENAFSFTQIRNMVLGALMAALMAVGAYIAIPVGPVPIVLQNMFVMMAGLILGPWWGAASVGIYMLAGILGMPVFSGGGAGLVQFMGPTGGYLFAYLPAVVLIGLISGQGKNYHDNPAAGAVTKAMVYDVLAMVLGSALVYAIGVSRLKSMAGFSWGKAWAVGMAPFLIGDVIKIAANASLIVGIRNMLRRFKSDE
ncbi:biotin transport system substrate-specific component [Desulfatibacillum alkenivorans DSM 16219]|jgi:biotin transport system substrate-specific component|uniref:Biotin transporter n=1 Tax=Desulfatibacillum alkenivorans DSM 16219 TaxID=1121393 RepID=A0A1M6T1M3_9BACT|nr:biotin transporter BioY [Desulfatibacillum alkenivorans]SHK50799.1 biotin transport system substrate-specific component [Desulfatibacillum alkenivorans DSM 16219]